MSEDALSDVLKTVRLTGAAFFDVAAQDPWSVHSPARDLILPRILPGADHLIAYHVVTAGHCFASLNTGESLPLEAGEVVIFTNADPHVMSSVATPVTVPSTSISWMAERYRRRWCAAISPAIPGRSTRCLKHCRQC